MVSISRHLHLPTTTTMAIITTPTTRWAAEEDVADKMVGVMVDEVEIVVQKKKVGAVPILTTTTVVNAAPLHKTAHL